MNTLSFVARHGFWRWIILAFLVGTVLGVVLGVALLVVIQAMISYAG